MRLAPIRARGPACGEAKVRDALRAIAGAQPDPAELAGALSGVRALLDRERARLRRRGADGAPGDEIAEAEARLLDGTVIGLCDLVRRLDRSGVAPPPLAAIGRGDYGRQKLTPGAGADLLFLVAAEAGRLEQGVAVAQFVARELVGLGWRVSGASRTVRGCLAETHLDPAIALDLGAARLVWGRRGLFAELQAGLVQEMRRAQVQTTWRAPVRTAVLPA
jgi:UTP:GlnB (protein PII) uridylyltransferase